ncbi:MAG: hypothetical protein AABY22_21350 [Nanoarchaeota archaeon]
MKKIILDLCGGTGSWAKPYKDAGYKVITITLPDYDIRKTILKDGHITFVGKGKSHLVVAKAVYGILAAPPCTMFSFARTNAKKPRDLKEGMECVRACLEIIWYCMELQMKTAGKTLPLKFWCLENPYHGFLKNFLGKPAFTFDPWEFGDDYQKRTALWGSFFEPKKIKFLPEGGGGKDTFYVSEEKMKELLEFEKGKSNNGQHFQPIGLRVKFDYMASKDIHPEFFGKFDRATRRSITPQGFAQAFYKANL